MSAQNLELIEGEWQTPPKHESTTTPGLVFWAESVDIGAGDPPSYVVMQQVLGFPATEAWGDWFGTWDAANQMAQKLARGEAVK